MAILFEAARVCAECLNAREASIAALAAALPATLERDGLASHYRQLPGCQEDPAARCGNRVYAPPRP